MDKLIERIANRPLVDENEIETGSYEITEEEINEVAQLETENELWKQRVTFAEAKRIAEAQHDYNLAAYMLRDLPLTKSAELADLAHALHSETASKGDWVGLRDLWDKAFREALKAGGE